MSRLAWGWVTLKTWKPLRRVLGWLRWVTGKPEPLSGEGQREERENKWIWERFRRSQGLIISDSLIESIWKLKILRMMTPSQLQSSEGWPGVSQVNRVRKMIQVAGKLCTKVPEARPGTWGSVCLWVWGAQWQKRSQGPDPKGNSWCVVSCGMLLGL